VAKLQVFDRMTRKVLEFITAYKLFIRMKIREDAVKEVENLEYEIVEEFLINLRKEFREGDKKAVKVVELKRLE